MTPTIEQIKSNHAKGPDDAEAVRWAAEMLATLTKYDTTHDVSWDDDNDWFCSKCGENYDDESLCMPSVTDLTTIKALEDEGDNVGVTRINSFDLWADCISEIVVSNDVEDLLRDEFASKSEPWNRLHAELAKRVITGEWPKEGR